MTCHFSFFCIRSPLHVIWAMGGACMHQNVDANGFPRESSCSFISHIIQITKIGEFILMCAVVRNCGLGNRARDFAFASLNVIMVRNSSESSTVIQTPFFAPLQQGGSATRAEWSDFATMLACNLTHGFFVPVRVMTKIILIMDFSLTLFWGHKQRRSNTLNCNNVTQIERCHIHCAKYTLFEECAEGMLSDLIIIVWIMTLCGFPWAIHNTEASAKCADLRLKQQRNYYAVWQCGAIYVR